ncbi:hypothetical protein [Streptosporangium subroseum]|nr:hypothetical protein OHB15_36390 [Streptosporangium subroseum]
MSGAPRDGRRRRPRKDLSLRRRDYGHIFIDIYLDQGGDEAQR